MKNKYFKVSYQGVHDGIGNLVFVWILWYISSKYFEQVTNPEIYGRLLKIFPINNSFDLLLLVAFGVFTIRFIYWISHGLVTFLYYSFDYKMGKQSIYPILTGTHIKFPLSKKDYWEIKKHPKFTKAYPEEKRTYFDMNKLNDWAEKIINNELKKLKRGKKDGR